MSNISRQPSGIPAGGQFAEKARAEAGVQLIDAADGFSVQYPALTEADAQYATVRTTNGGEISGIITTQGPTYPIDIKTDDGRWVGISGWRVKDVRLEDTPAPALPAPIDEWSDHLTSAGLHVGEWAEFNDTRVRIAEASGDALDVNNPGTWTYDPPAVATYAELSEIVEGFEPVAHYRIPGLVEAEFRLEKNFNLDQVAMPREPHDYAMEMDEDDGNEQGGDVEDAVAAYEELHRDFASRPWNVAPLIAFQHDDGGFELLDGNHRAALALDAGRSQHPTYVVRSGTSEPAPTQPLEAQVQVRPTNPTAGEPVPGEPGWHYPRTKTRGHVPVTGSRTNTREGRGEYAAFWARQFASLLDEATP